MTSNSNQPEPTLYDAATRAQIKAGLCHPAAIPELFEVYEEIARIAFQTWKNIDPMFGPPDLKELEKNASALYNALKRVDWMSEDA
jgi:hypothetical protein